MTFLSRTRRSKKQARKSSRRQLQVQTLEKRFLLTIPMILSPSVVQENLTGREGDTLVIPFTVQSPDENNTLQFSYAVTPLPAGAELQVDPDTTQRRLIWWPDFDQAGDYNLDFVATDERGQQSTRTVNVQIADRTDGTPGIRVSEKVAWNTYELRPSNYTDLISPVHGSDIRIDAIDPENRSASEVSLTVAGLPPEATQANHWSTDVGTNVKIGWRPKDTEVGTHVATIIATDRTGHQTTMPITFDVRPWSTSNNMFNFFPHVYSGAKEAFYNRDAAIKEAVVAGTINVGAVATTDSGQGWTAGDNPDDVPPDNARYRLMLLDSQGTETSLGGPLKGSDSVSLDTTKLADGQYVIAIELLDGDLDLWHPWNLILTVDNHAGPVTGPQQLAAVGTRGTYARWNLPGGALGVDWVTVDGPSHNPTEPYPFKIVDPPQTEAERDVLIPISSWVSEPLTKTYSYREEVDRFQALTPDGHPFISGKMVKGEKYAEGGRAPSLITAEKYVGFDGPRNNNQVSDSSHYTPDPNSTGFIGVEASGRVFRVDRDGTVTTLFGPRRKSGVIPYQVEADVSAAQLESQQEEFIGAYDVPLDNPWDLTFDPLDSNILYIADLNNHRIAKIDFSQAVPTLSTLVGQAGQAGFVDGNADTARFNGPISVTADPTTGVLYVSDRYNHSIRQVDRDGNVSTVVGKGPDSVPNRAVLNQQILQVGSKNAFLPDSVSFQDATIYYPYAIRIDSQGNLLISEGVVSAIRRLDLTTHAVEKVRIVAEWGIADNWFEVDRRGNIGPVDDMFIAEGQVGGQFIRMSKDGSRYDNMNDALFVLTGDPPGTYNSGYGAAGSHSLTWSMIIDDNSAALGVVSHHRTSFTLLRPRQPGDVSTSMIDNGAFTNGLVIAAAGTAQSFPFDAVTPSTVQTNSGAIAMSLRPSLFNLYGASGHAFVGDLGTYDDLAQKSDVDLANFIRGGGGGSVPRPEITGVDLRDLIYYIRAMSLDGKFQAPDLQAIGANLEAVGLYPQADTRSVEIRDIEVTPLSDTTVTVSWVTDEDSIGFLQYGPTSRLGQFSAIESGYAKQHEVTLRNLLANRVYHLRVREKDVAGNLTISRDVSFELGDPDTQPPTVPTDLQVIEPEATRFGLNWSPSHDAVEMGGYRLDVSTTSSFSSFASTYQNYAVGASTSFIVTGLLPETTYHARLRAMDAAGNVSANSPTVTVTLPEAPPNTAPIVNVGDDRATTVLDAVLLNATVDDDGLPLPGNLTYSWNQVSGPGSVNFTDASSPSTSATFSKIGTYTLQASVSDGDLTGSDSVVVTVNQAPGGGLVARWKFNGNTLDSARSNHATGDGATFVSGQYEQAIAFAGADSSLQVKNTANVLAPPQITISTWVKPAEAANSYLIANGGYQIRTTADHRFLANLSNLNVEASPSLYFGEYAVGSWTHLSLTWDGTTIRAYQDGVLQASELFSGDGLRQTRFDTRIGASMYGSHPYQGELDDLRIYRTSLDGEAIAAIANRVAPVVTLGEDQTLQKHESVELHASVTVRDLPPEPGQLSIQWRQISGPGQVTFHDATNKDTSATFSKEGTYVLELSASDGEVSGRDRVTVTVEPIQPLGHWQFDGNLLDSACNLDGSAAAPVFIAGQEDQAILFDDDSQRVVLADQAALLTPSQITVATWVKPNQVANAFLVANRSYELRTTYSNEFLAILRNENSHVSPAVYFGHYNVGVWTHLSLTWDGESILAYQDGILQTAVDFQGTSLDQSSAPMSIGTSIWGNHGFRGTMDDLRIYGAALDAETIESLAMSTAEQARWPSPSVWMNNEEIANNSSGNRDIAADDVDLLFSSDSDLDQDLPTLS